MLIKLKVDFIQIIKRKAKKYIIKSFFIEKTLIYIRIFTFNQIRIDKSSPVYSAQNLWNE